jgi:hypothetical protein
MNYDLCPTCDTVQRIESDETEETKDDRTTWRVITLACGHSVSTALVGA